VAPKPDPLGSVELRHIEETDDYEVGAEVEGVWTSFARVPGEQVRANVANVKENEAKASKE